MVNPVRKISKQHFAGAIRSLVFGLLLFLYLWLVTIDFYKIIDVGRTELCFLSV